MSHILIGALVVVLAIVLVAMVFGVGGPPTRFVDADADGEPDETPEEKRRGLEGRD